MRNNFAKYLLKKALQADETIWRCGVCGGMIVSRSLYNKALGWIEIS